MTGTPQADITLHTERVDGAFDCEGFTGLPSTWPCWIVLSACGNTGLEWLVRRLREEIVRELLLMAPAVRKVPPVKGCPRVIPSPTRNCMVSTTYPQARKLLVLVGDSSARLAVTPLVSDWLSSRPFYSIMPVYPIGETFLPQELSHLQITSWRASIEEVAPALFAAAGLTSENFRVFISYKQDDTRELADQLFDALSHLQFDVFLDRFRIPPAANFQARLRQELADKAMVVLLESARASSSDWIRFEVGYARKNRLGLVAVNLPGAPPVRGVREHMRVRIVAKDILPNGTLERQELDGVCARLQREHQRSIVRRRYFLRQSFAKALLHVHAGAPSYGADGMVRTASTAPPGRDYGVWLSARPPELSDFHAVHASRLPLETAVVVGPADALEPARRASLDWLAQQSTIRLEDEGHMLRLARGIAKGAL